MHLGDGTGIPIRTWKRLAQLGADGAQGHWFSRAVPAAEIGPWILRWTAGREGVIPIARTAAGAGR